jgi:GMP synthase-like glutamine amidotransferase
MLSLSNDGLITILSSKLLTMAEDLIIVSGSKAEKYEQLLPQIHALISMLYFRSQFF